MTRFLTVAPLALLIACGGISDSTPLTDVDEDGATELCEELANDYPAQTFTCDFEGVSVDVTVGFEDTEDCSGDYEPVPESCTATVGDYRDCIGAQANVTQEDVCDPEAVFEIPAECAALFACFEG